MRIAILGSGGVGGYFGARLAAKGEDVVFLARGAHLAAMRAQGLRIVSPDGNLRLPSVRATDDPTEAGPVDVVFFAVKLYDTESALALLPPLVGPRTLVVPFQNGVESVDVLTRAIGAAHVAGGTCYVSAVIDEPGVIRHTAMARLVFGEVTPGAGAAAPASPVRQMLEALLAACQGTGFEAELSDRIMEAVWAKFARLTAFSGMTSVTRCPIGVILQDPDLHAMMTAALSESFAVARASGIPLDPSLVPKIMAANATQPPGMKSSMLEDLERGRRLELPFLSGAVVARGAALGVPTPTHRFIATVLKPFVAGTRR